MKKTAFLLMGDRWHDAAVTLPLVPQLLPEDAWDVTATEDPAALYALPGRPDLLVNLKDPVENNQIPTPAWCDARWTETALAWVSEGTGFLAIHAALADLPKDHPMVRALHHGAFVTHPAQCPVSFVPTGEHPVTAGIEPFTFPENDEHYVMDMLEGTEAELLGETRSEHGRQPGLWAHTYGRGRVCCVTPGHVTPNLLCPGYLRLLRNAADWCAGVI